MDENRREDIVQMMEITDCDEMTAVAFLRRYNDLGSAVQHFFDGNHFDDLDNEGPSDQNNSNSFANQNYVPQNETTSTQVARPAYHYIFQLFAHLVTMPVRIPIYILSFVFNYFLGYSSPKYKNLFEYIDKHLPKYKGRKSAFYNKSLSSLCNEASSKDWKYLVVYIHELDNNDSFLINLLESNVSRLISEHNAVLYGTISRSSEDNRLRPDLTFLSRGSNVMIYRIRGNTLKRHLVISSLDNKLAVNVEIVQTLNSMMEQDAEEESIRNAHNESRQLMQEQNREYEESLKRDLERIAKEKSEKEAAEKLKREEEQKLKEAEERTNMIKEFKAKIDATPEVNEGSKQVLIRFPNGSRKILKYEPSDNVEKIFETVIRSDVCPLHFKVHMIMPHRPVPCLPSWYYDILEKEDAEPEEGFLEKSMSFEEANIEHGSTIYVDSV